MPSWDTLLVSLICGLLGLWFWQLTTNPDIPLDEQSSGMYQQEYLLPAPIANSLRL